MRVDGSGTTGAWRRGREVFDAYDVDRVLSESLADDLVNDLAGLPARTRPGFARGPFRVPPAARHRRPRSAGAVHLRLLGGGPGPA